jgi:hypothetical protein
MAIDYKTPEDVKEEKQRAKDEAAYESNLTTVEVKKPEKKMEDPRAGVRGQRGYANGGSASSRADGIASKGKTRGRMC